MFNPSYLTWFVPAPQLEAAVSTCTVNGQPCGNAFAGIVVGSLFGIFWIAWLVVFLLMIVSMWKLFVKAGKPGWAAIIPIYNVIVLLEIIRKPLWWVILYFIPIVNIVISVIVLYRLSLSFGKGIGFTIGLYILPFIFYPILAFGSSVYNPLDAATPAAV